MMKESTKKVFFTITCLMCLVSASDLLAQYAQIKKDTNLHKSENVAPLQLRLDSGDIYQLVGVDSIRIEPFGEFLVPKTVYEEVNKAFKIPELKIEKIDDLDAVLIKTDGGNYTLIADEGTTLLDSIDTITFSSIPEIIKIKGPEYFTAVYKFSDLPSAYEELVFPGGTFWSRHNNYYLIEDNHVKELDFAQPYLLEESLFQSSSITRLADGYHIETSLTSLFFLVTLGALSFIVVFLPVLGTWLYRANTRSKKPPLTQEAHPQKEETPKVSSAASKGRLPEHLQELFESLKAEMSDQYLSGKMAEKMVKEEKQKVEMLKREKQNLKEQNHKKTDEILELESGKIDGLESYDDSKELLENYSMYVSPVPFELQEFAKHLKHLLIAIHENKKSVSTYLLLLADGLAYKGMHPGLLSNWEKNTNEAKYNLFKKYAEKPLSELLIKLKNQIKEPPNQVIQALNDLQITYDADVKLKTKKTDSQSEFNYQPYEGGELRFLNKKAEEEAGVEEIYYIGQVGIKGDFISDSTFSITKTKTK